MAPPGNTYPNGIIGLDGLPAGPHSGAGQNGHLTAEALPMSTVALILSKQLNRTVLDKTGLAGDYDFTLDWTPAGNHATTSGQQGADNAPSHESSAPSIFTTLEQQLGLKLESQKVPMEILVIDHAENASEN